MSHPSNSQLLPDVVNVHAIHLRLRATAHGGARVCDRSRRRSRSHRSAPQRRERQSSRIAAVAHDLGADLDQLLAQAGRRPRLRRLRHRQRPHEIAEIVGHQASVALLAPASPLAARMSVAPRAGPAPRNRCLAQIAVRGLVPGCWVRQCNRPRHPDHREKYVALGDQDLAGFAPTCCAGTAPPRILFIPPPSTNAGCGRLGGLSYGHAQANVVEPWRTRSRLHRGTRGAPVRARSGMGGSMSASIAFR
jgi:hypothetical protein